MRLFPLDVPPPSPPQTPALVRLAARAPTSSASAARPPARRQVSRRLLRCWAATARAVAGPDGRGQLGRPTAGARASSATSARRDRAGPTGRRAREDEETGEEKGRRRGGGGAGRTTCVSTIRRQQYRLSWSRSSASLRSSNERPRAGRSDHRQPSALCARLGHRREGRGRREGRDAPLGHVCVEQGQVRLPQVADDLAAREAGNARGGTGRQRSSREAESRPELGGRTSGRG